MLRVRILVSLGYAQAESGSLADGTRPGSTRRPTTSRRCRPGRAATSSTGSCCATAALLLHRAGRVVEGIELFDEAIERLAEADAAGDPVVLASAYLNRGHAYIDLAQADRCRRGTSALCLAVCARARHRLARRQGAAQPRLRRVHDRRPADRAAPLRGRSSEATRQHAAACCPRCGWTRRGRCCPPGWPPTPRGTWTTSIPRLRRTAGRPGPGRGRGDQGGRRAAGRQGHRGTAARAVRGTQVHPARQHPVGGGRRAGRVAGGDRGRAVGAAGSRPGCRSAR